MTDSLSVGYFGTCRYEVGEHKEIKGVLDKNLGPEYLSERAGPGGSKLKYIDATTLINLANEVFGFNGWSHSIVSQTVDFLDEDGGKYNVGISTIVRVTLKDGSFHEDCGYGSIENCRQKGAALEKAKKESVTDALKRTLRHFGNILGNCIYSKHYLKGISRLGNPPKPAIDPGNLHRQAHIVGHGKMTDKNNFKSTVHQEQHSTAIPPAAEDDSLLEDFGDDDLIRAADLECIPSHLLVMDTPDSMAAKNEQKPPLDKRSSLKLN
jgi:DNA repair and recombination protein RAD52